MADEDVPSKQGGEVGDLFGIVHHLEVFFHCMDSMFMFCRMTEYFLNVCFFNCRCLCFQVNSPKLKAIYLLPLSKSYYVPFKSD